MTAPPTARSARELLVEAAATAASASATAASTLSWLSTATSTGSKDLFGADMRSLSLQTRRV